MMPPDIMGIFSKESLTKALLLQTPAPKQVIATGMFDDIESITTTTYFLEIVNGKIHVLSAEPRGSNAQTTPADTRRKIAIDVPHIPYQRTIMSSEFQNIIPIGGGNPVTNYQTLVDKWAKTAANNLAITANFHATNCLQGVLKNSDGSVLVDYFAETATTQQTQDFGAMGVNDKDIRQNIEATKKKARTVTSFEGMMVFCGEEYWSRLIGNSHLENLYYLQQQARASIEDSIDSFKVNGCTFIPIQSFSDYAGCKTEIAAKEAYFVPQLMDMSELFTQVYAPGTSIADANMPGRPFYISTEMLEHGKGIDIWVETNPLMVCKQPNAIIKATTS